MLYKTLCPAKINLFLHILGKRADGYHMLESLVTFADCGDELSFELADELTLEIIGPYANELNGFDTNDNLIIKAARLFEQHFNMRVAGKFSLVKNLPVASGIGGGSSNAAMTIKLLMQAYDKTDDVDDVLLALGADVPVCFNGKNVIMSGIGEQLDQWPELPNLHAVLVNPNEAVSTAKIFGKLNASADIAPYDFAGQMAPIFSDVFELVKFLKNQRNDMQSAAVEICPEIANVLNALNECDNVLFAQMSGSGATCFAIFNTAEQAETATKLLAVTHPNWWIKSTLFSG
ncbi:MAG: 4-(cytidine 5'-diphospho)-2-C-methyl-D-erythritol kinase [Alphaproteobacteria bacterium]|nr:4-(cytidine 5'-diphospho)-2-C-methyl-D-erythritol kinase [Alphaproteobacteria bacterium]